MVYFWHDEALFNIVSFYTGLQYIKSQLHKNKANLRDLKAATGL